MIWIIAFCYNTKTATRYFTGVIPTKTTHKKQTLPMDSSKNNNEQKTKNIYVIIALWQPLFRGGLGTQNDKN